MSDLSEARNLVDAGQLQEAREIVVDILYKDYDDLDAWLLLTECALDQDEYTRAVREALRLDPENVTARRLAVELARESRHKTSDIGNTLEARQRRSSVRTARSLTNLIIALLVIGGGAAFAFFLLDNQDDGNQPTVVLPTDDPIQACIAQVQSVLSRLPSRCEIVGKGEVCLANLPVEAESAVASGELVFPGDHAALTNFSAFNTGPFGVLSGGLLAIRASASFEDSDDASVLFILTSGARLAGFDDQLSQFTLSSNPVVSECPAAHPSGILASAPLDQTAHLIVNGAEIDLSGTAFLQADVAAGLRIVVLDGQAILSISPAAESVNVSAGQWTSWTVDPTLLVVGTPQAASASRNTVRGDWTQLRPLAAALGVAVDSWQIPGETVVVALPSPTSLNAFTSTTPENGLEPSGDSTRTPTPLPPDLVTAEDNSPTPELVSATPNPLITGTRRPPSSTPTVSGTPPTATATIMQRPSATGTATQTLTATPSPTLSTTPVPPSPTALPPINATSVESASFEGVWQCSASVDTLLFDYFITIEPVQSLTAVQGSARLPAFGDSIVSLEGQWIADASELDANWFRIPERTGGDPQGWLLLREVDFIYDAAQGSYQPNGILRLSWSDLPDVTGGLFIATDSGEEILVGLVNECVQVPS